MHFISNTLEKDTDHVCTRFFASLYTCCCKIEGTSVCGMQLRRLYVFQDVFLPNEDPSDHALCAIGLLQCFMYLSDSTSRSFDRTLLNVSWNVKRRPSLIAKSTDVSNVSDLYVNCTESNLDHAE